jgi:transcriptional regulator with AAA-type ATPase domain/tetratricopeptide (TPR) repeat protein
MSVPAGGVLLGDSSVIRAVREQIDHLLMRLSAGRRPPSVILQGETGTGKGLLAHRLHRAGPRAKGPFVDINCAAIPESLLEAELFGFERGAFTDARRAKIGLFSMAHTGVLFLDEVGLLPREVQAKLLKAIEERSVRPLGSTHSSTVDVWIIAATNEDLLNAVRQGAFREDLYHRLAAVTVYLPPLRERGDDVMLLAQHFLQQICADYGVPEKMLEPDAALALRAYPWPGNVRELANVLERVTLLTDEGTITASLLGLVPPESSSDQSPDSAPVFRDVLRNFEREHLLVALQETGWNISYAADRLGIPRNTLRYRMAQNDLHPAPGPHRRRSQTSKRPQAPRGPQQVPRPKADPPASTRAEARQITYLGVTLHGPANVLTSSVTRALEVALEKVRNFKGMIADLAPRTFVAVFGIEPVEDAPRRAGDAALAICKAADRETTLTGSPITFTVVVHAMPGTISESDGVRRLDPESKASASKKLAALATHADPNRVLVSKTAAEALERWFELEPITDRDAALEPLSRMLGPKRTNVHPGSRQHRTRFIGRDRELGWLRSHVAELTDGRGHVVGLVGEPGSGKSRLLHEFQQHLANQPVNYLEGRCLSHATGTPYAAVLDLLRRAWVLDDADSPALVGANVRRRIETAGGNPDEQSPYVLRLFGSPVGAEALAILSPEAVKRRTFDIVRHVIFQGPRPVVLSVEDVHWIDKTSEEFLASVVDSVPGAPLLFLSTYRPGHRPPWIDRSYVSQLALSPLPVSHSRRLVHSILPAVNPAIVDEIVVRAEGNPFFLEELALSFAQRGDATTASRVPLTIGEVLAARMDQLPTRLRGILQAAAVLGRDVPLQLLDGVLKSPRDLAERLRDLVRVEFLHEQPQATGSVYAFRHALIQETAYNRLSNQERRRLHGAAGATLETLYPDRQDEVVERLAYHYGRSDDDVKAIDYLVRSAERATAGYSLIEAVAALKDALARAELLPAGKAREIRALGLVVRLGIPLMFLGRLDEVQALLTRYEDRLERLADPSLAGPYFFLRGGVHDHLGHHVEAKACAHRSIDEASRCGDEPTRGRAHMMLAHANFWAGEFTLGVENARQAASRLLDPQDFLWYGMSGWIEAWNDLPLGRFDEASEAGLQVRIAAQKMGDRRLESYGACIAGWVALLRGDLGAGLEACQRAVTLAPDPLARAVVLGILGEGYRLADDIPRARTELQTALDLLRNFHMPQMECWTLCRLAEAEIVGHRLDVAAELSTKGLALTDNVTFPYGRALAQRSLGRIRWAAGGLSDAVTHLSDAGAAFTRMDARYELAHTLLDLASIQAKASRDRALLALAEAQRLFAIMELPKHLERTRKLAETLGVGLPKDIS